MKRLLWQNVAVCAMFLIFTISTQVWFYYFLPRPVFQSTQPEIVSRIEGIKDIEHLRKIALLQANNDRTRNAMFNDLFSEGIEVVVSLALFATIIAFINVLSVLKLERKEQGATRWWQKWF